MKKKKVSYQPLVLCIILNQFPQSTQRAKFRTSVAEASKVTIQNRRFEPIFCDERVELNVKHTVTTYIRATNKPDYVIVIDTDYPIDESDSVRKNYEFNSIKTLLESSTVKLNMLVIKVKDKNSCMSEIRNFVK